MNFKNKNDMHKKQIYIPVSCLCSVYKGTEKDELTLALKSLLIQEYIPNQIIIVLDGPIKKDLKYFIHEIKKKYNIIETISLKNNEGLGKALKEGLNYCKNNLIARFDSDDINMNNRLKIQYDFLMKNKDIDVLGSYVKEYNFRNFSLNSKIKKVPINDEDIKKNMLIRNPINHPSIIFKKDRIENAGSYDDMKFFEDYYLWLKCKKLSFKFHNINQALVSMRRKNNLVRRKGYKYILYEMKFSYNCFIKRLINFWTLFLFIFKLFIRINPDFILQLAYTFDPNRTNYIEDLKLKKYITVLKKYNL